MRLELDSLNLAAAEKLLCETALVQAGSIVEAANLLGITRHALKRRIIKHNIAWPRPKNHRPVVQVADTTQQVVAPVTPLLAAT
ncbi:MAG: hypothetical protein ACPG4T_02350 [Nannocystaceae bacterium]